MYSIYTMNLINSLQETTRERTVSTGCSERERDNDACRCTRDGVGHGIYVQIARSEKLIESSDELRGTFPLDKGFAR